MFSDGRVTLQINYNMKKAVETEVIKSLQKAGIKTSSIMYITITALYIIYLNNT